MGAPISQGVIQSPSSVIETEMVGGRSVWFFSVLTALSRASYSVLDKLVGSFVSAWPPVVRNPGGHRRVWV